MLSALSGVLIELLGSWDEACEVIEDLGADTGWLSLFDGKSNRIIDAQMRINADKQKTAIPIFWVLLGANR